MKTKRLPEECDICSCHLTQRQSKIYEIIDNDESPCNCNVVMWIDKLEKENRRLRKR